MDPTACDDPEQAAEPELSQETFCPDVSEAQRDAMEAQVYVTGALHDAMRSRTHPEQTFEAAEHLHSALTALDVLQSAARQGYAKEEMPWRCAKVDVAMHLLRQQAPDAERQRLS